MFNERYDEVVLLRDIEFHSLCEHHLLPFTGRAHVAYLPDGKVVGLSKLARLVEGFARRPQVQERLTTQIADAIMEELSPIGSACVIEAVHTCMTIRGAKKHGSTMVTSAAPRYLQGKLGQPIGNPVADVLQGVVEGVRTYALLRCEWRRVTPDSIVAARWRGSRATSRSMARLRIPRSWSPPVAHRGPVWSRCCLRSVLPLGVQSKGGVWWVETRRARPGCCDCRMGSRLAAGNPPAIRSRPPSHPKTATRAAVAVGLLSSGYLLTTATWQGTFLEQRLSDEFSYLIQRECSRRATCGTPRTRRKSARSSTHSTFWSIPRTARYTSQVPHFSTCRRSG